MNRNFDVIIAGSGAAGLYGALNLPKELNILVLSKMEKDLCNTALAQGGIAGVYNSPEDSPEYHKHDTFVAGGFENDPVSTDVLVNEAKTDIARLIELGCDFDKKPDGDYHRTLEGGHGMHRIFHHKDSTGAEIERTLLSSVKQLPNVTLLENAIMCDAKMTNTGFSFLVLQGGEFTTYNCHYAIFATGGIGRVYEYTTNSPIATGYDGATTTIELFDGKKVVMSRSGSVTSNLIVELGKKHHCVYGTPYGDLMVGVNANYIRSNLDDNGGKLDFKYVIDVNSSYVGDFDISIEVK